MTPTEPAKPPNTTAHLAWAGVALAVVIAGTVLALRGMEMTSAVVPDAARALGELLAPRIETTLRTNLAMLAGSPEAFLVAHSQGGHLDATSDKTLHTVLGIPLGTTRARVEWDFSVDLGIDLKEMAPGSFLVECDAAGLICRWYVPDPTHRPPAIATDTLTISVDGAPLVSRQVEDRNAADLVARIAEITESDVRSEAFWSGARENVRRSLTNFANEHLRASEAVNEPLPSMEVVFASERRREQRLQELPGIQEEP